ncbi:MAG: tetratricopeptide repeat protein [bacterium]|nr:tetratricopeptide repeat protein [bacterium]
MRNKNLIFMLGVFVTSALSAGPADFKKAAGYYSRKEYQKAFDIYESEVKETKDHSVKSEIYYWMGQCCLGMQKCEKARMFFELSMNAYPDSEMSVMSQAGTGDSYFIEKKYRKALNVYTWIYNMNPKCEISSTLLFMISECFKNLGEKANAEAYMRMLKKNHPKSPEAMIAR